MHDLLRIQREREGNPFSVTPEARLAFRFRSLNAVLGLEKEPRSVSQRARVHVPRPGAAAQMAARPKPIKSRLLHSLDGLLDTCIGIDFDRI